MKRLISTITLLLFCTSAVLAFGIPKNRVVSKKVNIRVRENGKERAVRVKVYGIPVLKVKNREKNLKVPFVFDGVEGRYILKASWKPKVKIDVKLLLPSGGVALLSKKFGNQPGSKFFEIKNRNFSKNNKGMKAAFCFSNDTGVDVSGSVTFAYAPRTENARQLNSLEHEQNKLAERQRESSDYLRKRITALEKAVQKLTTRVRILERGRKPSSRATERPVRKIRR